MTYFALDTQMPGAETYMSILWIVALFVIFYILMIHPQRKQQKKDEAMRNSLEIGDRICTIGGIVGKVVDITDDEIVIETCGNRMKFNKWAIRNKIEEDGEKKSK